MTMNSEVHDILNEDCERFQRAQERILVEEVDMSEIEETFMRRHRAECPSCAAFADAIESLQSFDAAVEDEERETIRETVLKSFESKQRKRRFRWAAAAAVIIISGTAAVAGYRLSLDTDEDTVRFALTKGNLSLNTGAVAPGKAFLFEDATATTDQEDALIEADKKLFVALEKSSKMRVLQAAPTRMRLKLDKGRMAVHLVPRSGMTLSVEVPDGIIRVTGTIFVVTADGARSEVEVVRGAVAVEPQKTPSSGSQKLKAGWSYSFSSEKPEQRSSSARDNLLRLLGFVPEKPASDEADDAMADAETGPAGDQDAAKGAKGNGIRETPSPEALLQAARACRAKKDWNCAVDNYGKVVKLYPNRPDAITTLVPMAQIMLENLKRPSSALSYFRQYQQRRPNGGLSQEALWGECNALHRLKRSSQEQACLERYVQKYPGSLYSLMAKSRLEGLLQRQHSAK